MNIEDSHHGQANPVNALLAHTITISTDTTTLGAEQNMAGFNAITFNLLSATITDGAYAVSLVHSDETGGTFTPVDAAETLGDADYALADDDTGKRIGYIGKKQFVKLSIVSTATTTGGVFSGLAIKSRALSQPVAD